jgi:hypothetical protein
MNDAILKLLEGAAAIYLHWWLLAAAIALILVDAYFPTDWPARLGYFCAAAGLFFLIPLPPLASLAVAIVVWIGLELLHRFWWGRLLQNAPAAVGPDRAVETDPTVGRGDI